MTPTNRALFSFSFRRLNRACGAPVQPAARFTSPPENGASYVNKNFCEPKRYSPGNITLTICGYTPSAKQGSHLSTASPLPGNPGNANRTLCPNLLPRLPEAHAPLPMLAAHPPANLSRNFATWRLARGETGNRGLNPPYGSLEHPGSCLDDQVLFVTTRSVIGCAAWSVSKS